MKRLPTTEKSSEAGVNAMTKSKALTLTAAKLPDLWIIALVAAWVAAMLYVAAQVL